MADKFALRERASVGPVVIKYERLGSTRTNPTLTLTATPKHHDPTLTSCTGPLKTCDYRWRVNTSVPRPPVAAAARQHPANAGQPKPPNPVVCSSEGGRKVPPNHVVTATDPVRPAGLDAQIHRPALLADPQQESAHLCQDDASARRHV